VWYLLNLKHKTVMKPVTPEERAQLEQERTELSQKAHDIFEANYIQNPGVGGRDRRKELVPLFQRMRVINRQLNAEDGQDIGKKVKNFVTKFQGLTDEERQAILEELANAQPATATV
jgi:alkylation response protein AidB-like acyl-CoA dehydrogenase